VPYLVRSGPALWCPIPRSGTVVCRATHAGSQSSPWCTPSRGAKPFCSQVGVLQHAACLSPLSFLMHEPALPFASLTRFLRVVSHWLLHCIVLMVVDCQPLETKAALHLRLSVLRPCAEELLNAAVNLRLPGSCSLCNTGRKRRRPCLLRAWTTSRGFMPSPL